MDAKSLFEVLIRENTEMLLAYLRAGVRDTWKLIQMGEETLLFDLKNDPTETRNVASQQPKLVEKLKKSLAPYKAMSQQNSRRRR